MGVHEFLVAYMKIGLVYDRQANRLGWSHAGPVLEIHGPKDRGH